jgi:hypothetical protein
MSSKIYRYLSRIDIGQCEYSSKYFHNYKAFVIIGLEPGGEYNVVIRKRASKL